MRIVRGAAVLLLAGVLVSACSDPDRERLRKTTIPTYDKDTGKLTQLTYDRNKDGIIDTWTDMDGTKPLQSRIDFNEDGKIDRWEYYDDKGALAKVGFSRSGGDKPDAWAYAGPDGKLQRIEGSSTADEKKIDEWEYYDASKALDDKDYQSALVRDAQDTNGDGKPDKWDTYDHGALKTVEFDMDHDGKPDRRLTYDAGKLVLIESAPDASGRFTRKTVVH